MTSPRTMLISGAGIAGATLGYWLARHGFDVTVVERALQQRSSGSPVDVRGDAVGIAKRMGIVADLRERATTARRATIVDASGRPIARIATQNGAGRGADEIEIPRADLADVLLGAAAADVDLRWGDRIVALSDRADRVEVTLASGTNLTADVVIGADGVRSATRRLAFGPRPARRRHLGLYVGTTRAPGLDVAPDEVQIYNEPGRMASIHPGSGVPIVAYLFRRPELPGFDPRDVVTHRAVIAEAFDAAGWRVPELLRRTGTADDVFLDSVAQVRVPDWSVGRVALVGDAASCVSLLGDGSSAAMIGAYTLASALAAAADHSLAFRRYQHLHRRRISSAAAVRAAARLLVPGSRAGIAARNAALRAAELPRRGSHHGRAGLSGADQRPSA